MINRAEEHVNMIIYVMISVYYRHSMAASNDDAAGKMTRKMPFFAHPSRIISYKTHKIM